MRIQWGGEQLKRFRTAPAEELGKGPGTSSDFGERLARSAS